MSARIVIAAARSGEGKTSITLGLAAALRSRGHRVSVAKVGPDYLDTGWHSRAAGRASRNLDLWTMGVDGVRAAFSDAAEDADIVLVEGVMGLFDGHRLGVAATSTADVARLLGAPVLLVVDASRAGASVAALAHGFATYDPDVRVAGVVLDRFRADRERMAVQQAFDRVSIPVLGWVPTSPEAQLGSRHLGLVQSEEDAAAAESSIEALGRLVEQYVDLDAVFRAARRVEPLPPVRPTWTAYMAPAPPDGRSTLHIAVARDEAFSFYYADNLAALEDLGACVVPFSPLHDDALPEGIHGVYLGGGYPELYADRLSANGGMCTSIRAAAGAGVPVYAECGGMLYLLESLADSAGRVHPMAGVVPARAAMDSSLQRVGYVEATVATGGLLGEVDATVRAHEFRYSSCEPAAGPLPAWIVDGEPRGFVVGPAANVVASYLHLNFAGCPQVAAAFIRACAAYATSYADPTVDGGTE